MQKFIYFLGILSIIICLFMNFDEKEFYLPLSSKQLKKQKQAMLKTNSQIKTSPEDIPSSDVLPKSSNDKKRKTYPFKRTTDKVTANDKIANNGNTNSQTKTSPEDVPSGYILQRSSNNRQYKIRETERNIKNKIRNIELDIVKEQSKIASELKQQTLNIGKNKDSKHYQLIQNIINRMQSMPHFLQYHLDQEHIQNLITECQTRLNEIEAGKNPFSSTHFISRKTETDKKLIPTLKTFLQKSELCLQQKLYAQQLEDTMSIIGKEQSLTVRPTDETEYNNFFNYFNEKYTTLEDQTSALEDLMQRYKSIDASSKNAIDSFSNDISIKQNNLANFMTNQYHRSMELAILSMKRGGRLVDVFGKTNQMGTHNEYMNNFIYNNPNLYTKDTCSIDYSSMYNTLNTSYASNGYAK